MPTTILEIWVKTPDEASMLLSFMRSSGWSRNLDLELKGKSFSYAVEKGLFLKRILIIHYKRTPEKLKVKQE